MICYLLYTLFLCMGLSKAEILNTQVTRTTKLDKPGSNIVMFENSIKFVKDASDTNYYYTVAKDYEWSFVDLNVDSVPIDSTEKPYKLEFEPI